MALILEILHSDGTRTRRRLDGAPLVLGRALSSDIVLDDPYVDARHARIALDDTGAMTIEDLGSVNGLVAGAAGRQQRLTLRAGAELRIGRTSLRVRDEQEAVAPALVDDGLAPASPPLPSRRSVEEPSPALVGGRDPRESWLPRITRWSESHAGRATVSAAAFVSVAIYAWLSSFDRSMASDVLAGTVVFGLMAAMWAGIWAIASRLTIQRVHFVGHFAIVSVFTLAGLVIAVVDEWYTFFWPQSALSGALSGVLGLALLAAMIAWHLSLSSRMSRDGRLRAGILVSVSLVALVGLFALVEDETFSDVPSFPGVVKPVGAGWLPTATVEDFGRVMAELKSEVDELAMPGQP